MRAAQVEKVNGVFTSPPYAEQRKKQYGGIATDKYVEWWNELQANVRAHLANDGSFFVNIKPHCENGERVLYVFDLVLAMQRQWGWKFIDELCWRRASLPGRFPNRFKNYFEPVYHFSPNLKIKFYPDSVKTERTYENPKASQKKLSGSGSGMIGQAGGFITDGAIPSNVLDIWNGEPDETHPAAFPLGLPEFFVKAFSDIGDTWFDTFLGSGTTIIAAHKNKRRGLGIEFLEKNCADLRTRRKGNRRNAAPR